MQEHGTGGHNESDVLYVGPNVTYSSILIKVFVLLEYAATTRARWLLKTDDDAYINVPQTVQVRGIFCHVVILLSRLLPLAICTESL